MPLVEIDATPESRTNGWTTKTRSILRSRRTRIALIFLVACTLRLAFSTVPTLSNALPDPYGRMIHYLDVAHNVREGRGLVTDSRKVRAINRDWKEAGTRLPPRPYRSYPDSDSPEHHAFYDEKGYLLLTLGLAKLTGGVRMMNVLALQSVLSAICAVMLYLAAVRLFRNEFLSVSIAATYVLNPLEITLSAAPDHPVWPVYAAVIGVSILSQDWLGFTSAKRYVLLVAAGSFLSFCVVQRSTAIAVAGMVIIGAFWNFRRIGKGGMLALVVGAIIMRICISAVPLESPTIGRSLVFHTLAAGLSEFGAIEGMGWKDSEILEYITTRYDVQFGTPEFDAAFKQEYLAIVSERPWLPFSTAAQRVGVFLVGFRTGRNSLPIVIAFGLFKILVLIGLARWWRYADETRTASIMLSCLGVTVAAIAIHVPIVPLLLVYVAPTLILLTPVAMVGGWTCVEYVIPPAWLPRWQ